MKSCLLLTGHFAQQKRRGAMLWIAEHLWSMGWHVTLASVGYSWASALKGDARLRHLPSPPRHGIAQHKARFDTVFQKTPIHPFPTKIDLLDRCVGALQDPLFRRPWVRVLKPIAQSCRMILVESGAPVVLAPDLRRLAPDAQLIYRVNDDLRHLSAPDWHIHAERDAMRHFDRISTGSPHLAARFFGHPNVTLDPMGVPRKALEHVGPSPFAGETAVQAVCAGTTQFAAHDLCRLASEQPDWRIHVFGRLKTPGALPANVVPHGETAFSEVMRYVAHAHVGLAPYPNVAGIEYQAAHSNRILLYRHFGLPILAPARLCVVAEDVWDIRDLAAQRRAATSPRRPQAIPDWSVLALRLIQNAEMEPVPDVTSVPEMAV